MGFLVAWVEVVAILVVGNVLIWFLNYYRKKRFCTINHESSVIYYKGMKLATREIKENLVYLALWLILFIAPVLTAYVRSQQGDQDHFPWHEVFSVWRLYVVYLVLFLVHNYLIAPLLIDKHKKLFYFSFVALMTVSFIIYQCQSEPMGFAHKPMHEGAPHDKMMPSEGHP